MQDIADHLEISKVSVSKALNGKGGVSDELRRSILAAAHEMGYDRMPTETVQQLHFAFVVSKLDVIEDDIALDGIFVEFFGYIMFDRHLCFIDEFKHALAGCSCRL